MIRKYGKILAITSVVMLLPILAGLLMWNQLPEQMPVHWNAAGEIDSWGSKLFVVLGTPLIMLAVQWLCMLGTNADPRKSNHSDKVMHLILWILPVLSVVVHGLMYAVALGRELRVEVILPVLVGIILTIIGNYLPKCRQNYTIGIKLPWTLHSEENWNRTHRMAGRLWVVGGIAVLLTGFLGSHWLALLILFLMVLATVVYSYILHRKGI